MQKSLLQQRPPHLHPKVLRYIQAWIVGTLQEAKATDLRCLAEDLYQCRGEFEDVTSDQTSIVEMVRALSLCANCCILWHRNAEQDGERTEIQENGLHMVAIYHECERVIAQFTNRPLSEHITERISLAEKDLFPLNFLSGVSS